MSKYNRMTIIKAINAIYNYHGESFFQELALQWDLRGKYYQENYTTFFQEWIIRSPEKLVITPKGQIQIQDAIIDIAIKIPQYNRRENWNDMIIGLKFDGYEVKYINSSNDCELIRMLPKDMPQENMNENEDEITKILNKYNFNITKGHLIQAKNAFNRGDWAASNAQFRSFFESYLNDIAEAIGCEKDKNSHQKREFLAQTEPPFLLSNYNECSENINKPTYIQGLMNRMHPEGSHPGLSEVDDATFRFQITLITARLLLTRFDKRPQKIKQIQKIDDDVPF